ncbi:MAG: Asp-tRNA(Asn)/Glu-tRNA(Gln) amidotransferase subunit GatA, partial [Chloroflexi bacterium]|nr:Asp-tRNA(Asn)/Glu-tRNA(Gln) amidotransferase GatCAB subunit A [Chloroflexota bacterium]NOH14274.1 Asp-tRNA(Asn)/Glu-tRNA(Gln) amidotransferase subunit GatA [Chloroflexota bacterium]
MTELCDLSAHELAVLIRKREVSAVEALDSTLARVEAVDGRPGSLDSGEDLPEDAERVHAFITLTAERARTEAEAVDKQLDAGEIPGPLAGVPYTVKDIFAVKNTPSTAASKMLANFVAPYTATPVKRMQAAGGVMLGKVNLDEYTYGSSTESSAFQPSTRNPWDPGTVPGP